MEKTTKGAVELSFNADSGVATLSLSMSGHVNLINEIFVPELDEGLSWALAREGLKGIIITSGHRDFCVDGHPAQPQCHC